MNAVAHAARAQLEQVQAQHQAALHALDADHARELAALQQRIQHLGSSSSAYARHQRMIIKNVDRTRSVYDQSHIWNLYTVTAKIIMYATKRS